MFPQTWWLPEFFPPGWWPKDGDDRKGGPAVGGSAKGKKGGYRAVIHALMAMEMARYLEEEENRRRRRDRVLKDSVNAGAATRDVAVTYQKKCLAAAVYTAVLAEV